MRTAPLLCLVAPILLSLAVAASASDGQENTAVPFRSTVAVADTANPPSSETSTNSSQPQDSRSKEQLNASPIQDNSFLVEEAYNQEDGVVQHISFFQKQATSGDWLYTETDEWPLRTVKHQLSFTFQGAHSGSLASSGIGDTAINYRYQLVGSGEAKIAVAPRLSLLLPTGDHTRGLGYGGTGLQTNLPVSIQHNRRLTTHWNAGATWIPHARDAGGKRAGIVGVNLGQSFVWSASNRFNALLETIWGNSQTVVGAGKTQWQQTLFVSPGIRWAYNLNHGLQVVPGVAVPMGVRPSAGQKGVILYLSFEHPLAQAHSRQNSFR